MPRYNPLKPNKPTKAPRPKPIPTGTVPDPMPVSHEPVLTENEAKGGLELRFPTRPTEDVLKRFHVTRDLPAEHRWHWHRRMKFWYARRNDVTRAFAAEILGGIRVPVAPSAIPADEKAANLVTQSPAALADAIANTEALAANVIAVNFQTEPTVNVPLIPRPPLPAWRQRLLRRPQ